jgi:hypothetical protein
MLDTSDKNQLGGNTRQASQRDTLSSVMTLVPTRPSKCLSTKFEPTPTLSNNLVMDAIKYS